MLDTKLDSGQHRSLIEAGVLKGPDQGAQFPFLWGCPLRRLRKLPLMTNSSFATKKVFKVKSNSDADS